MKGHDVRNRLAPNPGIFQNAEPQSQGIKPVPAQKLDEGALKNSRIVKQLGTRLGEFRAARNWSILRVSNECGVSHAFVTQILEGRANPSLLIVEKIAVNLGIDIGWLLGYDGADTSADASL